jgi:glycerophosphoryl diester phosphodiesterase
VLLFVGLLSVCAAGPRVAGTFELGYEADVESLTTYIAVVVADPDGDDLEPDGGEHVVIRHDLDIRNDLGGWWIEDAAGNRLNLGIGIQVDPGAELRVHAACGTDTETAVSGCLDDEVLDDQGDVLTLRNAAGAEVHRFAYGDASE